MDEHLTPEEISRYREGWSTPAEIARVQDHADACESCRTQLRPPADGKFLKALFEPEPDEQELVLYVARQLPLDRAAEIEAHVHGCAACTAVVNDLRQFQAGAEPKPIRPPRTKYLHLAALAAGMFLAVGLAWWGTASFRTPSPQIAAIRDGAAGQIVLLASGELRGLPNLDPRETAWISDALRNGRLPAPSVALVPSAAGALRGTPDPGGFQIVEPVNIAVLSDRPTFRWQALSGALSYEVTVFTGDESIVAHSGKLSAPEWQPGTPLPRQRQLGWQVTAQRRSGSVTEPAPPAPRAWFIAIPAEMAAQIDAARAQPSPSHLLIAALCASAGLTDDAARELAILRRQNPDSALVQALQAKFTAK